MYEHIIVTVKDRIGTITLNRPEFGNAFAKESYSEIPQAVASLEANPEVGVIVLTGTGKHFSAGGDIKRFKGLIESKTYLELDNIKQAGNMAICLRKCKKPTIAKINGAAAGAGCSLALACDFRVMEPTSKLVMAFINLGLSGDTCGLYLLEKLVGIAKTAELMMTGRQVAGQEALDIGLTTLLAEAGQLDEETHALAKTLAHKPLFAIRKQKELMERFYFSDMEEYMEAEAQFMAESSYTKDFEEAVDAFLEKRTPEFKGE